MTKREQHEIAVVVREIMNDECDEIRAAYKKLNNNNTNGLRAYVKKECIEFWTNHEPYPDDNEETEFKVNNQYINFDDCWCFIRDGLLFDLKRKNS